MFRRTLSVFLVTAFAALVVTIGYALLGFAGPATTVDAARSAFEEGRYRTAIQLLDITEADLDPRRDAALRAELLDLRRKAYAASGNLQPALRDLETLRELRPDDDGLLREQIRLLIAIDQPLAAERLAVGALETRPGDSEMLELAGEATQADYQTRIRGFVEHLDQVLDQRSSRRAAAHVRRWLYGDEGDPATERAFQQFRDLLEQVSPDSWAAGELESELRGLRELLARALQLFRRALEGDGQPVGAYLGLAYALEQAERDDDRQWLGELYLHRFDHIHRIRAANDLAALHLSHDRDRAVLDIHDRLFAGSDWREQLDQGRLDNEVRHLLLAAARAAQGLEDVDRVVEIGTVAEAMQADARLDLTPELDWIRALHARATGDPRTAINSLSRYAGALRRMPQSDAVVQASIEVMNSRLELARELNWRGTLLEQSLARLEQLDPDNPVPMLERSRLQIEDNDPAGALIALRRARQIASYDDQVLRMYAYALDAELSPVGRGAEQQLRRCIDLDVDLPADAPEPLLLPIAERALETGRLEIAMACARRASEAMTWARWPRELIIKTAFRMEQPELARLMAQEWLTYHPGDLPALRALLRARRALNLPAGDLTLDLLLAGERSDEIAGLLLRDALDRGDRLVALHLARAVEQAPDQDPETLLLVADAYEQQDNLPAARDVLQRAADATKLDTGPLHREAIGRYFLSSAALDADPGLLRLLFERCLQLNEHEPEQLVHLTEQLLKLNRPDQAFLMLTPVLTSGEHARFRSGVHFLLGGRIALALGDRRRARDYLQAAMTFDDGAEAGTALALLLLIDGQPEQAADAWWATEVKDLADACLAARLGRMNEAVLWAQARFLANPHDAAAVLLRAVVAPPPGQPELIRQLCTEHAPAVLDTLAGLATAGFETIAVQLAQDLVDSSGGNPMARVLLARAAARAGDRDQALEQLEGAIKESPLLLPAYEEAIRTIEDAGLDPLTDNPLAELVTRDELLAAGVATPSMSRLAARRRAAQVLVAIGEQGDEALERLASLWSLEPKASGASLDYVDLLASTGRIDLALRLVRSLEDVIPDDQRQRALGTYFSLVETSLQRQPDAELEARAIEFATEVMTTEAAYGIVTNFLYSRELVSDGPLRPRSQPERVARLRALLDAHLRHAAGDGQVSESMLAVTLMRLHDLAGREAALLRLQVMLRAHPSRLGLHLLRGRWLAATGRRQDALDGLRWLYHYAPSHPAVLGVTELAARAGMTTAADRKVVNESLPTELRQTPEGRLTVGLLALRDAEHGTAIRELQDAAARDDGAPLYFRGLAAMAAGDVELAQRCLRQMRKDYPDSALSVNVGHFLRQLEH